MEALAAFQGPPVERFFRGGAFLTGAVLRLWPDHGGACGRDMRPGYVEPLSPHPGGVAVEGVRGVQGGASQVGGDGGQAGGACLQVC